MSTNNPVINFDEIKAKVGQMSPEDRAKKLAAFRERQLLQQKKQQAKGGQAAYNKKRMAEYKAMREAAIADGSWAQIEAQAKASAEQKFDEFLDSQTEVPAGDESEEGTE